MTSGMNNFSNTAATVVCEPLDPVLVKELSVIPAQYFTNLKSILSPSTTYGETGLVRNRDQLPVIVVTLTLTISFFAD